MNPKNKNSVNEAKEFLRSLRYEREYIQDLMSQAEELRVFIEGVGSALGSAGSVSASSVDRDERRIKGLVELEEVRDNLIARINEYSLRRAFATKVIMSISDPSEKRALLLYYFPKALKENSEPLFRSWKEVADVMNCDERTAQNYHGRALERIAKQF